MKSSRKHNTQRVVRASRARSLEPCEPRLLLAGFSAVYYDNADLTSPTLLRLDPSIDFDWDAASPTPQIDPTTFSARWTGQIKPTFSEPYTFTATADDGVRLWVNGT